MLFKFNKLNANYCVFLEHMHSFAAPTAAQSQKHLRHKHESKQYTYVLLYFWRSIIDFTMFCVFIAYSSATYSRAGSIKIGSNATKAC